MVDGSEPSAESRWLRENWASLTQYNGRWIAVKGPEIIGSADRLEFEKLLFETNGLNPLYALVWHGGI